MKSAERSGSMPAASQSQATSSTLSRIALGSAYSVVRACQSTTQ